MPSSRPRARTPAAVEAEAEAKAETAAGATATAVAAAALAMRCAATGFTTAADGAADGGAAAAWSVPGGSWAGSATAAAASWSRRCPGGQALEMAVKVSSAESTAGTKRKVSAITPDVGDLEACKALRSMARGSEEDKVAIRKG